MNFNITYTDSKRDYYSDYYRPHIEIFNFTFEPMNILKALGIKSFKLPTFEEVWNKFAAITYGKQKDAELIFRYGTICRSVFGDQRNTWQKTCDRVNRYFFERRQAIRNGKAVWNGFSFFDWGAGRKFTNMTDIHAYEHETGKKLIGWRDVEVERAKTRRFKEEDQVNKIAGKMKEVFHGIQKGKSYIRENAENRRKILREYGN